MKISLNWVRDYTKVDLPIDKLVARIGAQLGAVDEVSYLGALYKGIVVAKVVSCASHANADKLSVCLIDDSKTVKGVKRDKDGHIQVVCGAPNVRMGLTVAYCPPGVVVPSTADKDPLKLTARDIRGVKSYGMLASGNELKLNDDHTGILEISEKIKAGTPLSEVYKLDDYIIDIENKMFTHRPDCFGILGVAREIAGISHRKFVSPKWYLNPAKVAPKSNTRELPLKVGSETKLCPRFSAIAISGVSVTESPVWLQSYLSRIGLKPINNIVDLTNYYMLLTGQPLHAYDYDKISGHTLIARAAKKGEKITLLGGKQVTLSGNEVVIADKEKAVGLGGVMGGSETEVSRATKNIILECANFDKYSIHRTAMQHGVFTDAVTRFSKGQSPEQIPAVITKTVSEILEIAGGEIASEIAEKTHEVLKPKAVNVTAEFINERLGENLKTAQIKNLLENVEFKASSSKTLTIMPPFWRTDIEIAEDIVEEVGRLYGYDHLTLKLPKRSINAAAPDKLLSLKTQLRSLLSKGGANEVLSYSFVHGDLLKKSGQDPKNAFKLANALSPELHYYRLSLIPSLLGSVHPNIKQGYERFALFEINKTHHKTLKDKQGLPLEEERMALVFAANKNGGAAYFDAAKYLTYLLSGVGIRPAFGALSDKKYDSAVLKDAAAPFEPKRSAYVLSESGELLGIIGEFKPAVSAGFKLPQFASGFELNVVQILKAATAGSPYAALPKYPLVTQDICLKVKTVTTYQKLFDFVWSQLLKLQPDSVYSTLEPVDIYQAKNDSAHKQVTFRLKIASYERTLEANTVNELLNKIAANAKTKLGAVRV